MDCGQGMNPLVKVRVCLLLRCVSVIETLRLEGQTEYVILFDYISVTAVPCGNLSSPANGRVRIDGSTFGSQANYSCSEGYVLNDNSSRMCQADGQWSGSEPTCEGMPLICVVKFFVHVVSSQPKSQHDS